MLKSFVRYTAWAALLVGLLIATHFVVIECAGEVAVLRANDGARAIRLWIVDDANSAWIHSAGPEWIARFANTPVVEVEREGMLKRYRATLTTGPHPQVHELLREKYGWVDRWVRLIGPDNEQTRAVRLDEVVSDEVNQ